MNKEKIKEIWHKHTQGDMEDVNFYNSRFGGWNRPDTTDERLLFTEHRLVNLMVCLNEIMAEVTRDEHSTSIRSTP